MALGKDGLSSRSPATLGRAHLATGTSGDALTWHTQDPGRSLSLRVRTKGKSGPGDNFNRFKDFIQFSLKV